MSKLINISDDLTGANALSALLTKNGIKCAALINLEGDSLEYKAISYSTNSRSMSQKDAYEKVNTIVKRLKQDESNLFSKRIDSTMRGNVGAEIDAMLDEFSDSLAIVVAAYPSSGRISVGGYLLVNSVPLQETGVSKDPKCPLTTSRISDILKKQSKYRISHIGLEETLMGSRNIEKKIKEQSKTNKIIIIDATTDAEIREIAKACKNIDRKIIPIDPGPFTAEYFKLLTKESVEINKKIMMTIGSVTNLTRVQLENIKIKISPHLLKVNSEKLLDESLREGEINMAINILSEKLLHHDVIGVVTTIEENDVIDLFAISKKLKITTDKASNIINESLAKITKNIIEKNPNMIGGLYTSGGDVTLSVCESFGVSGIDVKDELAPLTVYGRLIGNSVDSLPIITKGGLIGNKNTGVECIKYLQTKISTETVNF